MENQSFPAFQTKADPTSPTNAQPSKKRPNTIPDPKPQIPEWSKTTRSQDNKNNKMPPPPELVVEYPPGEEEWDAIEHIFLFHYMAQHHRHGRSHEQCALKLFSSWYHKFLWKDFNWCWEKAAVVAQQDEAAQCEPKHFSLFIEQQGWIMDDTEWDDVAPRFSARRAAAIQLSTPEPIRFTVETYMGYFQDFTKSPRDRADSGEIGDQLLERDVKGWNYEDESYWQMVDCAIEIAHAAIKHSGKKAKK